MKLIIIIFILTYSCLANSIGMNGIQLLDTEESLNSVKLKLLKKDNLEIMDIYKYKTENGNELSVTTLKEKVVYIENDWLQNSNSNKSLLDGFVFGKTTLDEIRTKFGTNGFTYINNAFVRTEDDSLAMFNCFELNGDLPITLVLVTKVKNNSGLTADNIGNHAKLDAIIIALPFYLDGIWGKEKAFDINHRKINL